VHRQDSAPAAAALPRKTMAIGKAVLLRSGLSRHTLRSAAANGHRI